MAKKKEKHLPDRNRPCPLSVTLLLVLIALFSGKQVHCEDGTLVSEKYFGTPIGALLGPGTATGTVYVVDESSIFIRGFTFSGSSHPLAFFMGGPTVAPDGAGFIIPDESGSTRPLSDYKEKDIVIRLPEGRTVKDLKWLSIWSRQVHANLGHVFISPDIPVPSPLELPPLNGLAHGVRSGPISIIDAQTILVTDFHYDGLGPAGYWWVTRGNRQTPQGHRLKDENDTPKPLRQYNGESFLIRMPDSKTIYDFDWFGVYCEEFQVDFGHVRVPQHVRVPPSPRMLGLTPESKLNCEVLDDHRGYEIRWIMDGDDIVIQLVAKLQPREYMAFGLGKSDAASVMERADAAVTWIDTAGNGHAVDYYLSSKEQCVGNRGSCPDLKHPGATDSITLLHAAIVNGFSMVTYKRPQLGVDEEYDQHIYSDGRQSILWAIGPLNSRDEVSYHSIHNYGNTFLDFARSPTWNCPRPDESLLNQRRFQRLTAEATALKFANKVPSPQPPSSEQIPKTTESSVSEVSTTPVETTSAASTAASSVSASSESSTKAPNLQPWRIPQIRCPKDRTLWAQIGPVGGTRGYQAITGRQGWGIAWYVNGLLIPEVILKRGVTYTFLVEGGNDETNGARRHPLYITDSSEGGFEFKSPAERAKERVFGGVGITGNGTILPTAQGRMCEWKITPATNIHDIAGTYERFEDFQKTLLLDCDTSGRPGVIKFTPDQNTPDTVYYQCFTHRYLGWKIRIVDDCNEDLEESKLLHSASMITPVKMAPPAQVKEDESTGVEKMIPKKNQVMKQTKHKAQVPMQKQHQPAPQQSMPQPMPQNIPQTKPQAKPHQSHQQMPMHPQAQPHQQRRPLPPPNQNRPNYGPYSSFYGGGGGGGGFHRNQLNMLPHTMLQGYHHYQPPMQYVPQSVPQQVPSPQQLNPYPNPQQQQPHNIFNSPQASQPNFYYQEPNGPVIQKAPSPQHAQPHVHMPQPMQPQVHYPMKKFGHRAPPQINHSMNTTPNQSKQFYGNRPSQHSQPQHSPQPQHPSHPPHQSHQPHQQPHQVPSASSRRPLKPSQIPIGTFGPTSTKPPLHGGFVPITLDSTSNRPPVIQETSSQNVWFPTGTANHNQSQVQLTTGSRLHKPNKPTKFNKKPTMDIYRIVTTPEVGTIITTTSTTTTTTTPSPVTRPETEIPTTAITTTIAPMSMPTTIKLVNDSSIEILTFVPMDTQPVYNGSTASFTSQTSAPSRFFPDKSFTDMNVDEVGEESQRRLSVMSSLNGYEHLTNPHYEPKPGTLDHVIYGAEKTSNQQQNSNADENILSDVLRLISFNIPSGRNRDTNYNPQFTPK